MSVINHLQHRVEETKRDLASVDEQISQLQTQRTLLAGDLSAYEKALAAEIRREGGIPLPPESKQTDLPLNAPNDNERVNKAEFARKFIRERAESGATPADLFKGFQDVGIPISKPYIYSLVQRLQNQKPPAIRQKRGKWFPVPESDSQMPEESRE